MTMDPPMSPYTPVPRHIAKICLSWLRMPIASAAGRSNVGANRLDACRRNRMLAPVHWTAYRSHAVTSDEPVQPMTIRSRSAIVVLSWVIAASGCDTARVSERDRGNPTVDLVQASDLTADSSDTHPPDFAVDTVVLPDGDGPCSLSAMCGVNGTSACCCNGPPYSSCCPPSCALIPVHACHANGTCLDFCSSCTPPDWK